MDGPSTRALESTPRLRRYHTNGDPGWLIRDGFRRKLLEALFDGRPEADAQLAADAETFFSALAADRKLLTIPADPAASKKLAQHYSNPALGNIDVGTSGSSTIFDFGEWKSEVATAGIVATADAARSPVLFMTGTASETVSERVASSC